MRNFSSLQLVLSAQEVWRCFETFVELDCSLLLCRIQDKTNRW
jgi:hypothetical protein